MKFFKKTIVLFITGIMCLTTGFAQENANKNTNSDYNQFGETWKNENKEAIFEVSESPYEKPNWGRYTKKDDVIYAIVNEWPKDGKLVIDRNMKVRTAFLDYGDKKLKTKLIDGNLTIFLPEENPNTMATVVKIQLTPTEDWANLERYSAANAALEAPAKNEKRVVFIGNSITDNWTRDHGVFFEENPTFVNRGISGQTSAQMLLRFRPDVIELQPKVVVISAGTNDIAGNRGYISLDRIAGNIFSMVELAKANNIKVILASVLPASSYSWSPSIEPADKIIELNTLLKAYAKKNKIIYLDYYTPMVNDDKGLIKELGRDTVHPNVEGYLIMEPMVKAAISKALK
ncbi:GDSL-type esterase/lipase family protein [uncultured Formosa sp.]|uniref:GDSL-type esterase/lipase family protein n=1 Tax=uncultured Formosa sp. TaxID=255435 RepID=UPI00263586C6|nr:GDSL-type esterase/lipase family protein [uncultured Formosa sp.]